MSETASSERIFGIESPDRAGSYIPICPECGSVKVWKDGVRCVTQQGTSPITDKVQRFLCRGCGFRFSDPIYMGAIVASGAQSKALKSEADIQLGANYALGEAKNLATASEIETVAGDREKSPQKRFGHRYERTPVDPEVRALADVFRSWLDKNGYCHELPYPNNLLTLSRLGADLKDSESVKAVIARHKVKDGTKLKYVYAYDALLRMLKIQWEPPHYTQEELIPFVPLESDLDQLIAAGRSRRMATYLQALKETFADPSEALRIEWIDVSGNIVTINHPVKGHLPRQLEVSDKLIAMLNALPKNSARIFPMRYSIMYSCFNRLRKRTAELTKNPRLLQITPNSYRHWGGTMLAYYTNGNVLIVKRLLGHKRVENTMKYIGMIHFKSDEFETVTSASVEEDRAVMGAGYQFVTERSGVKLWQRPKRFGVLDNTRRSPLRKSY